MAAAAPADDVSEFIASGRTGRRNAVPDIRHGHDAPGAADLPDALSKLSCEDAGASTSAAAGASAAAGTAAGSGDASDANAASGGAAK